MPEKDEFLNLLYLRLGWGVPQSSYVSSQMSWNQHALTEINTKLIKIRVFEMENSL